MPKFKVTFTETIASYVVVEAEDQEQAVDMVEAGDFDNETKIISDWMPEVTNIENL